MPSCFRFVGNFDIFAYLFNKCSYAIMIGLIIPKRRGFVVSWTTKSLMPVNVLEAKYLNFLRNFR